MRSKALLAVVLTLASSTARADWEYWSDVDPMTSKTTQYAGIRGETSLNLPFPYEGMNIPRASAGRSECWRNRPPLELILLPRWPNAASSGMPRARPGEAVR